VIDNRDATEIESIISRDRTDFLLVTEERDTCRAPGCSFGSRGYRARVVTFGQDDVLRP